MTRRVCVALVAVAIAAAACGGSTHAVRDQRDDDGVVTFECEVGDAEVWINDRRIGLIGDLRAGVALTPGKRHRLEVRHDDFHTHYAELEVAVKERRAVRVELAPRLP